MNSGSCRSGSHKSSCVTSCATSGMMNGVHHQAGGLPNLTRPEMFEEYKEFLLVSLHFVFQGRLDSEGRLGFPGEKDGMLLLQEYVNSHECHFGGVQGYAS